MKPQEYSYPFKKVETTKTLKAIEDLRYLASDGEKIYYKGEEVPLKIDGRVARIKLPLQ